MDQAATFSNENRSLILATFKRQVKLGANADKMAIIIDELVELFTVLLMKTDFLTVSTLVLASKEVVHTISVSTKPCYE